ncbi:hypothetical protein PCANC_09916 [Puccinia coronata f. sp. avenae]|uniref:Phosphatidylinositol N-acetylglucosaminyltransferase subunit H conserved domain-containing protein n=1 Tax=Puccinia coronata f. sp. avenae TaxID=200324 RepID=A0A2N5UXG3_9BASI|nr:hypothetical protein PCANC_09916 [Puccinia coronata f. sp. avenae]
MDIQKQKKTTFHTASSKPSSEEFQKLKFHQQSGVKSDFQPSQSRLTLQHISSTTIMYSLNSCSPVFQIYQPTLIVVAISILLLFLTWPSFWAFALLIFIVAWVGRTLTTVYSESILIMSPLGIQLNSTSLIRTTYHFVAREHIKQAVIHEAIVGWDVSFYLGLVVQPDGDQMYIHQVFNNLQPELDNLVIVWKGIRELLFQNGTCKNHIDVPLE